MAFCFLYLISFLLTPFYILTSASDLTWKNVTINDLELLYYGVNYTIETYSNTDIVSKINVNVWARGCGYGPGSHAIFYISGDWIKIRYSKLFENRPLVYNPYCT